MKLTTKVLQVVTQYHSNKQGAQAHKRLWALEKYGTEPRFKPITMKLQHLALLLEYQGVYVMPQELHEAIAELGKTGKIQVNGFIEESNQGQYFIASDSRISLPHSHKEEA